MLTFQNPNYTKEALMAQLQAHYDADEIIQGKYWENGKGCAVGCAIHTKNHIEYELRYGVPRELAILQDVIFENLHNQNAKEWVMDFWRPIKQGKYLTGVWNKLVVWILSDDIYGVLRHVQDAKFKQQKEPIERVLNMYLSGDFSAARVAARVAARAAYVAAYVAGYVGRAAAAADASYAAAAVAAAVVDRHAAYAAVDRAADAYAAADFYAARDYWCALRDKLTDLIKQACED